MGQWPRRTCARTQCLKPLGHACQMRSCTMHALSTPLLVPPQLVRTTGRVPSLATSVTLSVLDFNGQLAAVNITDIATDRLMPRPQCGYRSCVADRWGAAALGTQCTTRGQPSLQAWPAHGSFSLCRHKRPAYLLYCQLQRPGKPWLRFANHCALQAAAGRRSATTARAPPTRSCAGAAASW